MNAAAHHSLAELPGGALVLQGLADLTARRESLESLLVLIGHGRMHDSGLEFDVTGLDTLNADHRLYARLAEQHGDEAHARYNALLRELVSFERALEHRAVRQRGARGGQMPR